MHIIIEFIKNKHGYRCVVDAVQVDSPVVRQLHDPASFVGCVAKGCISEGKGTNTTPLNIVFVG